MNAKGWRPFWAALLAGLLVLVPLVGGTILLTRRTLRTKLASRPQSGVAIRQPKEENRLSLLVCTAPTETTAPGFLLLYLSASQNCIHALALPGELTVPFGTDEAALADCYRAAGPARCREALLSALALPEDTHYLALAPSVLQAIADRYGALRVGFSGALTADELARTGCSANVQALSAREAEALLSGMEGVVPPAHKAAARAAVWDALLPAGAGASAAHPARRPAHPQPEPAHRPDGTGPAHLRGYAGISRRPHSFRPCGGAAGDWDADAGRYTLTEDSRAAVQALFNVSPTDGQLSSASEP